MVRRTLSEVDDLPGAFDHLLDGMVKDFDDDRAGKFIFNNLTIIALEAANQSPRIKNACMEFYSEMRRAFSDRIRESELYSEDECRHLGIMIQTTIGGAITVSFASGSADSLRELQCGISWLFTR